MPATTATEVASSRPPEPRRPRCRSAVATTPSSERIVSHASVRIRYVTKNGASTRYGTSPRCRCRNAMPEALRPDQGLELLLVLLVVDGLGVDDVGLVEH